MASEYPETWDDVLHAPVLVLNVESETRRWNNTLQRAQTVGFQDVRRIEGIDGRHNKNSDIRAKEWELHGNPEGVKEVCGSQQAVYLGHLRCWKKMIDEKIAYATILEDDIIFHSEFTSLAPLYYRETPKDFHALFYGSSFDHYQDQKTLVIKQPNFGLYAYSLTLSGAKHLYNLLMGQKRLPWIYVIDIQLKYYQYQIPPAFNWYNWNGLLFPCQSYRVNDPAPKNHVASMGIVFPDYNYPSMIL